jgi:hypothetical protein
LEGEEGLADYRQKRLPLSTISQTLILSGLTRVRGARIFLAICSWFNLAFVFLLVFFIGFSE